MRKSLLDTFIEYYLNSSTRSSSERLVRVSEWHDLVACVTIHRGCFWQNKESFFPEQVVNDLSHFGNYRQKYGTGRRNVSSMQITLFSRVLSVAFTYVVVRYSILRERFCGFRSSPAVRSYPLFCRARDVRK